MTDQAIKDKLKVLLKDSSFGPEVDSRFTFLRDARTTRALETLKSSTASPVTIAGQGGEGTTLDACEIHHTEGGTFFGVYGVVRSLYIRNGYGALYEDIQSLWKTPTAKAVVLLGNAGTGKSWYQLYILRRLLRKTLHDTREYSDDADDYDFIFRQVGKEMYLIDIKDCACYEVQKFNMNYMSELKRCLYFFEPGAQKELAPLSVDLPSLSTISPYKKRLAEYKKGPCKELYFWPWSFTELYALTEHANLEITFDELFNNFHLYGGIIRHHLKPRMNWAGTRKELDERLLHLDLKTLQSKAANVDRDLIGDNVSGFVMCYDGKQTALDRRRNRESPPYFDCCTLRYTSSYVEEKVEEILDKRSLEEKMQVVLDRLNDHVIDISGKNLEAVATEFLRAGQSIQWEMKRAGQGDWSAFTTKKRKVMKEFNISTFLTKADHLLVPTNTCFPVADMVYSDWGSAPAVVFQCTWQPSHPFTIRALYELRAKHLQVDASKLVMIIMIVPDQEVIYADKPEADFLLGDLSQPLYYTKSQTVSAEELTNMWANTEVHILRPKVAWKTIIGTWLENNPNALAAT